MLKRKPIGKRNGLKIYARLKANKPMNKVSKQRKAELPQWEQVKKQAFDRAGNRCEIQGSGCLITYGLTPHHIIHKSQNGKDELDNIIIGCQICHNHHIHVDGIPLTKEQAFKRIGVK